MKRRRKLIVTLAVVALAILFLAVLMRRRDSVQLTKQIKLAPSPTNTVIDRPSVDLRTYKVALAKLENDRLALWSRYQRATTPSERNSIINQARESFERAVFDGVFPYWYGTKWDFNGTTERPGEGKIACGYFVATVLRDVGMRVQRTRLAQQASENIILSLTTNYHTKRFRQVPINSFVESVRSWGTGLYMVGLDVHVGFILNRDGEVYFIHSSYVDPYCVVIERGVESQILGASRYRVLGKISEDDDLILKWLRSDPFMTRDAAT